MPSTTTQEKLDYFVHRCTRNFLSFLKKQQDVAKDLKLIKCATKEHLQSNKGVPMRPRDQRI